MTEKVISAQLYDNAVISTQHVNQLEMADEKGPIKGVFSCWPLLFRVWSYDCYLNNVSRNDQYTNY